MVSLPWEMLFKGLFAQEDASANHLTDTWKKKNSRAVRAVSGHRLTDRKTELKGRERENGRDPHGMHSHFLPLNHSIYVD